MWLRSTMDEQRTKLAMALEDVFILVSVFALWPGILGWQGVVWDILKYAAVAGLIWILVRRVGRYRTRRDEARGE